MFSSLSYSETYLGIEAPECVGNPVDSEAQAKCITFFYARFRSTVDVLGGTWDVVAIKREKFWYIYPKEPTNLNPADKVLFKINAITGKPIGYE